MLKTKQLLGKLLSDQIKQKSVKSLINDVEFDVYSQFGEDGIIQFITHHLADAIKNKIFIEIGVEDYTEANTRFLLENNNWEGIIIDCCEKSINSIKTSNFFWRNNLFAQNVYITKDNIHSIISELNVPDEIGLFSLDIDSNDYWVLKSLMERNPKFKPAIIILEYNSFFGKELSVSIPYKENFTWNTTYPPTYFGASLHAYYDLLKNHGYILLGSTMAGNNAFFVHDNVNQGKLEALSVEHAYRKALFNLMPCYTKDKFVEQLKSLRYLQVINLKDNQPLRLTGEELTSNTVLKEFNCIKDFLAYEDFQFLKNAYRYLLCREPDENEFQNFLPQLNQGVPREEILRAIRFSEEGKKMNVILLDLKETNVFLAQANKVSTEVFKQFLSHNGFSRPAMIICETVNACNLNCIICAYSLTKDKRQIMQMDLFKKVINNYCEMGGGYLSLTPTVGDVFLDAKLVDRINYLSDISLIKGVSITTNAVLAKNRDIDELKTIVDGLCRIHISIYGLDAEEYLTMTTKDKFEEMLASVRLIIALCASEPQKIVFGFRLLYKKSNEVLRTWIKEMFGTNIPFTVLTDYANWGVLDVKKPLPGDATWILPSAEKKGQCAVPLSALQIAVNGDVSFCPCDDFKHVEELKLGNINYSSLIEMYNSDKVKKLYDFERHIPDFCRTCSFHVPLTKAEQVQHICSDPLAFIGG